MLRRTQDLARIALSKGPWFTLEVDRAFHDIFQSGEMQIYLVTIRPGGHSGPETYTHRFANPGDTQSSVVWANSLAFS